MKPIGRQPALSARDFRAAFGLGDSDQEIQPVDGIGVAMAAIQALNQRVDSGAREVQALREELQQRRGRRGRGGV